MKLPQEGNYRHKVFNGILKLFVEIFFRMRHFLFAFGWLPLVGIALVVSISLMVMLVCSSVVDIFIKYSCVYCFMYCDELKNK